MILYIDTTDFNKVTFGVSLSPPRPLGEGRVRVKKKVYKIDPHKSHETLAKLDEFLKSVKLKSTSPNPPHILGRGIMNIYVNKGPGSYTGVRIGVTMAQALGFAWDVPVKFLSNDKFILHRYTDKDR